MTKQELMDAVDSQVNRYKAIKAVLNGEFDREEAFLCTMIEDATEWAIHLTRYWCAQE